MFDTHTYFIYGTAKRVSIKCVIVRFTVIFLAELNKFQLKLIGFTCPFGYLTKAGKIFKLTHVIIQLVHNVKYVELIKTY